MEQKIIQGDCLEEMKKLESESIDLILTDPPYGLNKEGIKNDRDIWAYGLSDYYRVLKNDSWLCLYSSIKEIGNVINLVESLGFVYKWQHITYINNGMVRGRLGFNKFMVCLIFSKGNPKIKKQICDIKVVSNSSKQRKAIPHPTPKYVEAIEDMVKNLSKEGEIVLDCFMGSGSTGVACKNMNREFIGIELDKEYFELAKQRIHSQSA